MQFQNQFRRRAFLKTLVLATPVVGGAPALAFAGGRKSLPGPGREKKWRGKEFAADLVIIGGGLGGCAAALAAARNGLRVIMTEETD